MSAKADRSPARDKTPSQPHRSEIRPASSKPAALKKDNGKEATAAHHSEDAPQLRSNRPRKADGRSSSRSQSGETVTVTATSTPTPTPAAAVPVKADASGAPPLNPFFCRGAPTKPPSRKARLPSSASGTPGHGNNSPSSSSMLERVSQRSEPPSLPLHRATDTLEDGATNAGGSEDSEAGIKEFSRSYLTRLSLEDAVMALERLRFLMMSHTAAVTSSQIDGTPEKAAGAGGVPPQQMHVDPFKLSKRPLEEIAEELCSQLRRLTTAYATAAAADRCLLGVLDEHRKSSLPLPPHMMRNMRDQPLGRAPLDSDEGDDDMQGGLRGTFGPMVSTQHGTTIQSTTDGNTFLDSRLSLKTDDSRDGIDLHKPNPGPRIAYPQREDSEGGQDFGSTVYKYPNGMVVSYPLSTFGELVSTESGHGATFRSHAFTTLGTERRTMVSDGTQTDDIPAMPTTEKELHAYIKALETRLTEKQRLEAMRESRGAKKSNSISPSLTKLARSAKAKTAEAEKQ